MVGSILSCLPTRKGQKVLPGKFFLDDLTVAHWVWSLKQVMDKSQPEPSPILQRDQAGKKKAGQREGQDRQDKDLVNGPSRRATNVQ